MSVYNVKWILDEVARILEFDSTEPNQGFGGTVADPFKSIRAWLNETYTRIVDEASQEVSVGAFKAIHTFTWPASTVTYQLPREIACSRSLFLMDVTSGTPGYEEAVYPSYRSGGIYWRDRTTLSLPNSAGYSSAKDYEWHYIAGAEELIDDVQVPVLVPKSHRYLLAWATALEARTEVDEDATPPTWNVKVDRLMQNYLIYLHQGKLHFTIPTRIGQTLSNITVGALL
jgi:hypothetical protein